MRVWIENPEQTGHSRFILDDDFLFRSVEISNDKKSIIFQSNSIVDCRYQILFELALNYVARDQFRDCIVAAFAALERFMEHYLLVSVIEKALLLDQLETFWKTIGSQSERQVGAYHTAVLLREGVAIKQINQEFTKYRNKTIHQGLLPDRENTMKVLNAICLKISDRIAAQKSYDIFLEAKEFEYLKRKPCNVLREISINPFLGIAFDPTNPESTLKDLQLHIKHIQAHSHNDAIATWPNKSMQDL